MHMHNHNLHVLVYGPCNFLHLHPCCYITFIICACNYTLQYRYSFTVSYISSCMTRDINNNCMISHLINLHQSIHSMSIKPSYVLSLHVNQALCLSHNLIKIWYEMKGDEVSHSSDACT